MTQRTNKLTDAQLRAWRTRRPAKRIAIPDPSVSGLTLRLGPSAMTWSLRLRVKGEGGVSRRGTQRNGKVHRVPLGDYPQITLEAARSTANTYLDQAKRGINPLKALAANATAGGLTIQQLGATFLEDYVKMCELRAFNKYNSAITVHIVPASRGHLGRPLDARGRAQRRETKSW